MTNNALHSTVQFNARIPADLAVRRIGFLDTFEPVAPLFATIHDGRYRLVSVVRIGDGDLISTRWVRRTKAGKDSRRASDVLDRVSDFRLMHGNGRDFHRALLAAIQAAQD